MSKMVQESVVAVEGTTEKKGRGGKSNTTKKKVAAPKKLASHPPANIMVVEAVTKLNEKGGSSLQAIKKHIAGFYNVDMDKMGLFIRKALVKQVEVGALIQVKGTGASGSFKLPSTISKKPTTTDEKKPAAK